MLDADRLYSLNERRREIGELLSERDELSGTTADELHRELADIEHQIDLIDPRGWHLLDAGYQVSPQGFDQCTN